MGHEPCVWAAAAVQDTVRPDERSMWISKMVSLPCARVMPLLYPRLLPVHKIMATEQVGPEGVGGRGLSVCLCLCIVFISLWGGRGGRVQEHTRTHMHAHTHARMHTYTILHFYIYESIC